MSFKKNINGIKKNYSLGIIGGGQLALMLTEAEILRMTYHLMGLIFFSYSQLIT